MDNFGMCGLLINGTPLDTYGGAALLDYSVGETAIKNETFQGINRSTWHLLKSIYGVLQIKLTIVFTGPSRSTSCSVQKDIGLLVGVDISNPLHPYLIHCCSLSLLSAAICAVICFLPVFLA